MATSHDPPFSLAVLNPGGRDPFVDYSAGPGSYRSGMHPPVNFHAYAAATTGAFFNSTGGCLKFRDQFSAALVLIRRRNQITLDAVRKLKSAGVTVLVAWKECGRNQIASQLTTAKAVRTYGEILDLADGIISPTLAEPPRVGSIKADHFRKKVRFIPTPYPVDFPAWNFSSPASERSGIFIGTREFKTETRHHIQAVTRAASLAHEFNIPRVTVINSDKIRGLRILRELERAFPPGCLRIHEKPLPYPDYLKLLSSHRFVYQMDHSGVPGQVAGDCLLTRTVCIGGSSTIEKIAFPDFNDDGTNPMESLCERVGQMLHDDSQYLAAIDKSQKIARESLSFEAIARQLGTWPCVTRRP